MSDDNNPAHAVRRRRRKASPVAVLRLASSPPARTAYVILGTVGLVFLAAAVVGPKRVRRGILDPLREAVEPHVEKAWAEAEPLRAQITELLAKVGPEGRKHLAKHLQSWVRNFRVG